MLTNNYPILKEYYGLRKWGRKYFLINSKNGDHFELTDKQAIVLKLCNGENTIGNILRITEITQATKFIENQYKEGILDISKRKKAKRKVVRSVSSKLPLTDALFEITGECNLKCRHCYNEKYNNTDFINLEMNLKDWKSVINQIDKLGIRRIQISGGEPFLTDYWEDIIKYAKSKKIFIDAIATNATLITEEIATKISKLLKGYGALYISLEGITANMHDPLRGTGNFSKTIRGIKILEKHKINVVINTMLIRTNYRHMLEFHKFIKNKFKNIKGWRIGCPKILGRYTKNFKSFYVPFTKTIEIFCKITRKYFEDNSKYRLEMSDFFRTEVLENGFEEYKLTDHPCSYATNNCTIKPNGEVVFCASLEDIKEAQLGNVKNKPLRDIWFSKKHMNFQKLKIKDLIDCPNCKYVRVCGAGCRSNAVLTYNSIYKPDPRACLSMKALDSKILPLLPLSLQEQWNSLVDNTKRTPKWDKLSDIL